MGVPIMYVLGQYERENAQLRKDNADLTQRLAASEAQTDRAIEMYRLAERQLAELREPMACGHPKSCWTIGHPSAFGVNQFDSGHCTACTREKAQIAATEEALFRELESAVRNSLLRR